MPEQPEAKDKAKPTESESTPAPAKQPMFSKVGMIVLVVALLLEGGVAAVLSGTLARGQSAEKNEEKNSRRIPNIRKEFIQVDGVVVTVPKGVGGHDTCRIDTIRIEFDPDLSAEDRTTLENSIKSVEVIIRQKLEDYLRDEGYERILLNKTRQVLENKLKDDVIRLLDVTDREVRAIYLDPPVFP